MVCWLVGSDRELAYQQSILKYAPAADVCSVLTSLVFHKKDKAFAIYSGAFCSSCVLFDRVFRSPSMTSIRESTHQGHEAFSEHSRGRHCAFVHLQLFFFSQWNTRMWHFFDSLHILESFREVSFDRSIIDLQKIRPVVRYIMRFNKPICSFYSVTNINPKNQHLNQKMT